MEMLLESLESAIGFHKRFLHDLSASFLVISVCLVLLAIRIYPQMYTGKSRLSKSAACHQIMFGSIDRKIGEHR